MYDASTLPVRIPVVCVNTWIDRVVVLSPRTNNETISRV